MSETQPPIVQHNGEQAPFDPYTSPHVVAIQDRYTPAVHPFGVSYLGGLVVANPDQVHLPPRVLHTALYAALGFSPVATTALMDIMPSTRKAHLTTALRNLGAPTQPQILYNAIQQNVFTVMRGVQVPIPSLTSREQDVFSLIATHGTNPLIGRALGIEDNTVKTMVTKVMKKFNVSSRSTLATAAILSRHTPTRSATPEQIDRAIAHYDDHKHYSGAPYVLLPLA